MKTVLKLKISRVAPRKISVLLCQVAVATVIPFNVSKASVAKFSIQQKCA
jgi:hypothetical protein